jgi:phage shock protein E
MIQVVPMANTTPARGTSLPPLRGFVRKDVSMKMMKILFVALWGMYMVASAPVMGGGSDKAAFVIIDVRTEAEWNAGHLDGAILIPYDRITQEITTAVVDKKTKIYLYCRSGRRSSIGLDALKNAQYENGVNLGTIENAARELNRRIVK